MQRAKSRRAGSGRPNRTKSSLAAGVVATLSLVLAACGGYGENPDAGEDGQTATITLSTNQSHKAFMEGVIEEFEKANPNIKVDATYASLAQRTRLLSTSLRAGNAPDIFAVSPGWGGSSSLLAMAEAGEVADLSDATWAQSFDQSMLPALGIDDQVNGFVLPYQFTYLIYNVDLLDDLGVAPPKTFDELLVTCEQIAAAGKIPIAIAGGSASSLSTLLGVLVSNNVYGPTPDWTEQRSSGATTFASSPEWQTVFEQYEAMIDAQCFDPLATGTTEVANATAQIANGEAAMQVASSNSYSSLKQLNADLNASVTAFPGVSAEHTYLSFDYSPVLAMYAKSKHPDAVRAFFDFLAEDDTSRTLAAAANGLAVVDRANKETPEHLASLEPWLSVDQLRPSWQTGLPKEGMDVYSSLSERLQGLFTGDEDGASLLQVMDDSWN